jgi:3-dehydroquinate dehydratase / shikimate dehydrogenase
MTPDPSLTRIPSSITTERLILRPWKLEDFEPFSLMNADSRVREHFPSTLSKKDSDKQAKVFMDAIDKYGWGLWAVEVPEVSRFIGFIGITQVSFSAHFTPAVEIGWRLAYDHWGKGYATEGAQAALKYAFEELQLDEVVSFAVPDNHNSRKVMCKIGMSHQTKDDFDHPNLPEEHKLKRHVLYRIQRVDYRKDNT